TRSKRDWSSDVCSSDLIIGNYLTPVLLIILIFIILKGIFTPIEPTTVVGEGQFSLGFVQGYHTTDPLIPVIMASVIIANFKRKRSEERRVGKEYRCER